MINRRCGLGHWSVWVSVSFILVFANVIYGSTSRLRSLGGETRILKDDTNIFVYPSLVMEYPQVIAEPFDLDDSPSWAGATYKIGKTSTVGIMFRRPLRTADELSTFLANADTSGTSEIFSDVSSDTRVRLSRMDLSSWFDFMYGTSLSEGLDIGGQVSLSYDAEGNGTETTASAFEVTLGLSADIGENSSLDVAVEFNRQSFEDDEADNVIAESEGGTGAVLEVRLFFPVGESAQLVPLLSTSFGGIDVAPNKTDFVDVEAGLGVRSEVAEGTNAIFGVILGFKSEERDVPGQPKVRSTTVLLPKLVAAGETMLSDSFAMRVGIEREATFGKTEKVVDGKVIETTTFDTDFDLQFGFGFKFGRIDLDGIVEKDLFRDGPDFIGGSRNGGGFFSNATITYHL